MVCGSHAKTRAIYSTPPCPSLAASTAAYRRRSFSDSHPKNRCIFCSTSAAYPSMPHSLIQNLLRGKDTTASAIREVILDHILSIGERPGTLQRQGHWREPDWACSTRHRQRGGRRCRRTYQGSPDHGRESVSCSHGGRASSGGLIAA